MRLLHILTRLLPAGSEENTLSNCSAQVKAGHEVHLIFGREASETLITSAQSAGVMLHRVENLVHRLTVFSDLRAVGKITRLCLQIQPDIVHTHQSKAGFMGRLGAWIAGSPVILHGIHIAPFYQAGKMRGKVYEGAERLAALCTDGFISVSDGMQRMYLSRGIGTQQKHHVVRSGMDLVRFQLATPTSEIRRFVGLDKNDPGPVILMIAAFEPRKLQLDLIRGFQRFLHIEPKARLILLGQGPCLAKVQEMVASLGLERAVRFAGYRTDPENWIAASDLCVLLSEREGLPRVIVQYLAAGKPVLCSDLPGVCELVKHGKNGVVVRSGDPDVLAAAMRDVLAPNAYVGYANAARQTDVQPWDLSRMCEDTLNIYQRYQHQVEQGVSSRLSRVRQT